MIILEAILSSCIVEVKHGLCGLSTILSDIDASHGHIFMLELFLEFFIVAWSLRRRVDLDGSGPKHVQLL